MISNIWAWKLGLTKETKTELSGIIYGTAIVTSKKHKKWEGNSALDLTAGNAYPNLAMGNPHLGLATNYEEYKITLKGKTIHFDLDNKELFNSLKPGDKVRLGYKEVCENTYDYVLPNLNNKFLIHGILTEYRFVSAKRIFSVTRVIDGDTLVLNTGKKVRLIGIDSPEPPGNYYQEAKKRLEELVLGKEVKLEKDVSETDKYERLLRYVYVNGKFINKIMVEEGWAKAYPYKADIKYKKEFSDLGSLAKSKGLGVWKVEEKGTNQK